jgi:4-amino-4-deoxy-L-arabinose transferase-like glycosyltransferase
MAHVSLAERQQQPLAPAGERDAMNVETLPEETILSPFLQKLSRSAPFLFMGVLIFGALAWRPTTAPIELETLASAWHMHLRDTLVPLRNGIAAPEIPPLLQWLILGGWQVFGVSEWWPRLVPALAGIASVLLMGRTALVLWPHRAATPIFARLLLTGVGAFAVAFTMVEPQTLALPFVLASFHALSALWMARPGFFRTIVGWLLSAAAAALAVMAGGWSWALVPLLCAIGIWLLDETTRQERSIVLWLTGGTVISALALLPAYLWLRDLGRADLLVHFGNGWSDPATEASRAAPWTLLLLPVALYPWIFWKTLWRALSRHLREKVGVGFRLCLAFLGAALVAGLVSGWQLVGLLAMVCPLSLLGARLLATQEIKPKDFHAVVPGFLALFAGLIFFLMNIVPTAHMDAVWRQVFGAPLPIWLGGIGLVSGLSLLVIGYILAQLSPSHQVSRTLQVAILPTLLMTSLNLEFDGNLRPFFDLTPVASRMKQLQDAGISVAVFSDYRGEFDFAGRLEIAPQPVATRVEAARWAAAHPAGAIVTYFDGSPLRLPALPMFRGVARDRWVAIWPASAIEGPDSPVLNSQF